MAKNTESVLQALKKAFDDIDVSGDGRICQRELKALMETAGMKPNDKNIEDLMTFMDTDKSGDVCFKEFCTALIALEAQRREMTIMVLRQKFGQYDRNSDGFITPGELRTVAKESITDDEITTIIAKVDTNKDGKISFDEFLNALQST